jgi:nucleotide-binding universal stress UspA family protein
MTFHKIFVALDQSQLTDQVFEEALELAQIFRAQLRLFHSLSTPSLTDVGLPIPVDLGINAELLTQAYLVEQERIVKEREEGEAFLQKYSTQAIALGISTEFAQKEGGETGPTICEDAQQWGADLIIVGRRGRTGLAEILLGSISNYVLHHAHCCVLVVQNWPN